ncbi:proline-rich protein 35 [Bufo gargarizans]|uniref:proline-rich protein 35 n=1 Tax=Bufo gargarizans TaxID=30331 RepID=UPI001CF46191|nr:proline-rich protein 35 [Bufo gargarizans]XP_044160695.1 proline-rich protein 35 [Bufo gargarizans]XP_044160697.1 proline-rich protein 35 [Bufo gargarizans]XP_044160698.1 proline-rich protein 35 [Bufo gargarizans]
MSKDEEAGCKLNSTFKHKERKPKKPHYIPRPWGKPYNYKCFQCPFTCMEKSHLYNHMKYSLCKNSLSLLIESDWPYKKNGFLVPEMNLHETHSEGNADKQEACDSTGVSTKARPAGEKMPSEIQRFLEEDDERPEAEEEVVGQSLKEKSKNTPSSHTTVSKNETGLKGKRETVSKDGEPEFIITDVFSLEGHCEKEREEQRFVKATRKTSSNLGGSRGDQWKLLNSTLKKAGADTPVACNGTNIIPCYPPPTYSDYQEHQGLSLLGLNYPLNTNLFSYLNPTMTSGTAQLPFLASTAQLMHTPHSTHYQALQNTERTSFLPRFYYPLLFEHAFNTDPKPTTGKPTNQGQPNTFIGTPKPKTLGEPLKTSSLKSEEGKTNISWVPRDKLQNQTLAHNKPEGEGKWLPQTVRDIIQHQKEILGAYGVQASRKNEFSTQNGNGEVSLWEKTSPSRCVKRKSWLDRDGPNVVSEQTSSSMEGEQNSHNSTRSPITSPDLWSEKSPILDVTTCKRRRQSEPCSEKSEPMVVNASLLIGDLSRTLEEYGKVEKKLANLSSEDSGRQKTLGEQLGKIRLELLHIHQALEKASCSTDGPLDLSIKRTEDMDKEDPEKIPLREDPQTSSALECPPKQMVKVELLPPELATCYARPTKCEADSSVLLCPDGRMGSTGLAQTHIALQEEGGGVGFGRNRLQMENI